MSNILEIVVPEDKQEDVKSLVSTLVLLPREDVAVILSNANAFRVRRDIEKARDS